MSYAAYQPGLVLRRSSWPILPAALVVVLALGWTGVWFYAASRTATTFASWREREAKLGRIHTCRDQSIGGYPFRIEVRCTEPGAEFRSANPPLTVSARDGLIAAQVYDPTLLTGDFKGPLTISETGRTPALEANWAQAQVTVRGTPNAPERIAIILDKPDFARFGRGTMETVLRADHLELHGRIAPGSPPDNPAIEAVLQLANASTQIWPAMAGQLTHVDIGVVLTGLKDLAPKPWSTRLREMQAADGTIDIRQARFAQADLLVVGSGTLRLTRDGRLDGEVTLTIVGIEKLVAALGLDQAGGQYLARSGGMDRVASSIDRIVPGLGGAVRTSGSSLAIAAGIALLGDQTQIEGRKAVSLPLRFSNGAAFLGPIPLGQTPPLF